jgi:tetratricopeptide (TPR) repeat protein
MPKRRTEDVVHVVMTDHRVQRRPPYRDVLAELTERHPTEREEYRGEVVPYYPSTLSRAGDALYLAVAQVVMKNNLRGGVAELARQVARQQPREAEWYIQLGQAWHASGEPVKAVTAYEQAVRLRPRGLRELRALAQGLKSSGQVFRSAEVLRQAIQISPSDAGSWYQIGALGLAGSGRSDEAMEKLQKAIALDPDLPGVYTTLAALETAAGQTDRAEASLRKALLIDPYDAAAWDLAGRALTDRRRFPEALFDFERAIRYRPDFGAYLYDFALTLSIAGELDRARETAEAAVRADPNLSEPHLLLGRLFAGRRQLPEAAKEYREALRLRPDFGRTRLDLASVLAAQGDMGQAVEQLREAAKGTDQEVARLATEALQRLGQR